MASRPTELNLYPMPQKTVTIALMGESGAGKTTLINMLGQYLANGTLDEAECKCLQIYAPCTFSILDSNNVQHQIQVGSGINEIVLHGSSSTRKPQTYTFIVSSKNMVLNIVDTPGLASTGGVDQDNENLQDTLRYLGEYKQLDAICLLLKPTNPRATIVFEHVLRHIIRYLQPAILNNVMFIFTNARASSFKPGNTYEALKAILQRIPMQVAITMKQSNTYCIDNEGFRYLAASQNGVTFTDDEINTYRKSFDKSRVAINSLLEHINNNLSPVLMQGALSINESQRIALRLSNPILELVIGLESAIVRIEEYNKDLQLRASDVDLKANLFKFEHEKLVRSSRVHTDNTDASASVKFKMVFLPFFGKVNAKVNYSYNSANQETYSVDFVQKKVLDRDVLALIQNSDDSKKAVAEKINEQKQICKELKSEIDTATTAIASFYKFLYETNHLTDDDPFITAIESAMKIATMDNNDVLAKEIGKILQIYQFKKAAISLVQPQEIFELMDKLMKLKHCGQSFRELMNRQFEFNSIQYSIH